MLFSPRNVFYERDDAAAGDDVADDVADAPVDPLAEERARLAAEREAAQKRAERAEELARMAMERFSSPGVSSVLPTTQRDDDDLDDADIDFNDPKQRRAYLNKVVKRGIEEGTKDFVAHYTSNVAANNSRWADVHRERILARARDLNIADADTVLTSVMRDYGMPSETLADPRGADALLKLMLGERALREAEAAARRSPPSIAGRTTSDIAAPPAFDRDEIAAARAEFGDIFDETDLALADKRDVGYDEWKAAREARAAKKGAAR